MAVHPITFGIRKRLKDALKRMCGRAESVGVDPDSISVLALTTLRNEWFGGQIRSHQQMCDVGQLLNFRRIEASELAKQLLCPSGATRHAKTMHCGARLASTRLSSVSAGVWMLWQYRDAEASFRAPEPP